MPDFPSRGEFELLKEMLEAGFGGINDRLDRLNGKTDKHGDRITVLETKSGRIDFATLLSVLALIVTALGLFYGFH